MNTQTTTQATLTHSTPQPVDRARRSSLRPLVTSLLVGLLATLGLLVAAPAGAYTTTSRTGVPVTPGIYKVQGAHRNVGSAVTGPMWKPWIYQSGPVVYRVAVSGTQSVRVTYRVDRWNGSSWVLRHTVTGTASIDSTVTSAKAPALSILPSDGSGYYRVRLAMTWTSPIGAVLGSMNVTMSTAGDYTCSTTRTCTVGAGWVHLGA
jgi:hypothetical protein